MKTIPLSKNGKLKGLYSAIVDDEDYKRVNKWNWQYQNGYAIRRDRIDNKKIVFMHRYVMKSKAGDMLDHINNDKTDNRKLNLRECTPLQNSRNRTSQINSTSKYLGVCSYYHPKTKVFYRWRAFIKPNRSRRPILLGYFKREIDAAIAYDKAAIKYFRKFANLNFPKDHKKFYNK